MRQLRTPALLAMGFAFGLVGCEREITISPPIDTSGLVEAQFDPTNSIPVLRLIPSPTALAARQPVLPDGSPNPEFPGLDVDVYECEGATTKQCLAFVDGWPTSTPITLFFSGALDESTIPQGIKLFEIAGLVPTPVAFTAAVSERPAPPAECMNGGNGTAPDRGFGAGDIPPGIQVVLTPSRPLLQGTNYVLLVESDDAGGLRTAGGLPVEPSNLFALMNLPPENAPISPAGGVTNALLRSNVQGLVIAGLFPGKTYGELTADEKKAVDTAVATTGRESLLPLYGYFNQVIGPFVAAGVTTREKLVFANAWTTGGAPAAVGFDPLNGVFPFPNVPLMTTQTSSTGNINDVRVAIAPLPPCPNDVPAPGCDTSSAIALKGGLNTLNGFSTTGAIRVPFTGDVDPASLEDRVLVYPLNDQGAIDGAAVQVDVEFVAQTSTAAAELRIKPVVPLAQNTSYVVGVLKGLTHPSGKLVATNTTYELLKVPVPLIEGGVVNPAVEPALQCSTAAATGMLATPAQVTASATALEQLVQRPRWQTAFRALEGASTPISRANVLMAFTIKTQDITGAVDAVRGPDQMAGLLDGWDAVRQANQIPRIVGPLVTITGTAAIYQTLGVVEQLCLPICLGGGTSIPAGECQDALVDGRLAQEQLCQLSLGLVAGNLRQLSLYSVTSFGATAGNPFTAGTFAPNRFRAPTDPMFEAPEFTPMSVWVVSGSTTADPLPATIFQHGFGRAKEDGFLIANTMAALGHATILMDLPLHGARASDVVNNTTGAICPTIDPADVMCDPTTGVCAGGCDDEQDPSATGFLSPNLFGTRDLFRQATIDQLLLMRTLRAEGNVNGALHFIDGSNITYVGQSLGGITGGNFVAYANGLEAAVLNVPGGGLIDIVLGTVPQINAPLFAALAATGNCNFNVAGDPTSGCRDDATFRQFVSTASWVLDPGDPLATSIAVVDSHNGIAPLGADKVMIQMAVPDRVVPNRTTLALGTAYGFDPDDNSDTSNFQTYDFGAGADDCHGFLLGPNPECGGAALPIQPLVGAFCATYAAQQQAGAFLASGGQTITARQAQLGLPPPLACPTFN